MLRTSYIILRKTPFQESSLVVAGLSPDYGRLDFLIKGARSIGRRKFPVAELFRELSIQFREPRGHGLLTMRSCEPLESFDALALRPGNYMAACEYAAFLLRHTKPMLECHEASLALRTALRRLCAEPSPEPWLCLAKLAFLHESGFVPERLSGEDAGEGRRQSLLVGALECAAARGPLPEVSPEYWPKLAKWLDSICSFHSLK